MVCRRVEELIELLEPAWEKESDLNLLELLEKLGKEAGFEGNLNQLSDEVLIYHLKMRDSSKTEAIPGIKKDYEDDFKTALLKSRGIVK